MKTRIISGAVLLAILLSAVAVGSWYLYFFCLVASLIGMFELFRVFKMEKEPFSFIAYSSAVVMYIFTVLKLSHHVEIFLYVITLIALLVYYVSTYPKKNINNLVVAYFGIFYVALMISFVFRLRIMPMGIYAVWLVFICSWVNDTCAYFTGYFFGKRKMTPVLSPKKTVEGALGGIAGATIVAFILGIVAANAGDTFVGARIFLYTISGVIGSVAAIFGDLAASAIKRDKGIKDYGTLIPGHGGVLDRFDSVILAAPVVYWIVQITG